MRKNKFFLYIFIIVALFLIVNLSPLQDFIFSFRSFIEPKIYERIEKSWRNKTNDFLLRQVNSANNAYSGIATSILVERKEKKAIPILLKQTKSWNKQTRISAFIALGEIGDPSVIEPFMKIVRNGRENPQFLNAIDALSIMRYETIYSEILKMVNDGYHTSWAVDMLERFPEKPETLPALEKIANSDTEEYIKYKAKQAMEKISKMAH
ncbi:MAG: hypothetical protein JW919_03280 [Candidatus Omnitrophica bacterium]|nr:hypothetical protein [Candidatus Omnitrophota bacterium]